jgi:hypothetical protein
LARYVDKGQLAGGRRATSAAFLTDADEDYLSVNSLELESTEQIADCYRLMFVRDASDVAVSLHTIDQYNKSSNAAGVTITYNNTASRWEFLKASNAAQAYTHEPKEKQRDRPASPSHCGAWYTKAFSGTQERKFTRRMAKTANVRFYESKRARKR